MYKFTDYVKDVVSGTTQTVSDTVYAERLAICNLCEHQKLVFNTPVCSRCGCVLTQKCKHVKSQCPQAKW